MPFRPPSLRSIAAFEAAARHQSFSKAARELNLTHSAISHSIRGLEDRLGEALFTRNGRRVALTNDGEVLARRVRLSLSLMAEALDDAASRQVSQRLVVACAPDFAVEVLAGRLAGFREAFGQIVLELRTDLGPDAVAGGLADCAIAFGGGWPALAAEIICAERVFAVAAPAIAGPHARDLPRVLAAQPLIENPNYPWAAFLQRAGRPMELGPPAIVAADWAAGMESAAAGVGVCLARADLAEAHLRDRRLVRVGEEETRSNDGYHLVWNPKSAQHDLLRRFGAWLRADMQGAGPGPRLERVA